MKKTTHQPITIIALMLTTSMLFAFSQPKDREVTRVVFYNVENLFDTIDDPTTLDNEFLPGSKKKWGKKRYDEKITNLGKVLLAISEERDPGIIGLCEVENRQVVEDLADHLSLMTYGRLNYHVVHEESPDLRGIDVAFMYNPQIFVYESHTVHDIKFEEIGLNITTRDILEVQGKIDNKRVHFFVNHWPSRRGGVEASQPKRLFVAQVLKARLDMIMVEDPNARVLIMGDFNDETDNKSISEILISPNQGSRVDLVNLMTELDEKGRGTYNYRGNWNMLDQFIVSNDFSYQKSLNIKKGSTKIFIAPWMMFEHEEFGNTPSRTFGGPNYYGGYSDHLPILVDIIH